MHDDSKHFHGRACIDASNTIFQNQLPRAADANISLSQAFYADDELSEQKLKGLYVSGEYPIGNVLMYSTQSPLVSFPLSRVPLTVYDLPAKFRAIRSNDYRAYAKATPLNTIPLGRFTEYVRLRYQMPSMAMDVLARIPLHRMKVLHNMLGKPIVNQNDLD